MVVMLVLAGHARRGEAPAGRTVQQASAQLPCMRCPVPESTMNTSSDRPAQQASNQHPNTHTHTHTHTAQRRPAGLRLGASKIGSRIMKLNKHARMRARQRVRGESYAQVASDYGVPPQRELGGEGANGFERLMDAVAVQCCFPSMVTPCTPLRPQSTCNFIRAETPG